MTAHPNKIVVNKELTPACIPILLNAYKHGLFVSDYPSVKFDELKKLKYIGYYKGTYNDKQLHLLWLLPAGVAFVDTHFMEILGQMSLSYSYPIIKHGDIIEVTQDLANSFDATRQVTTKIIHSPQSGSSTLDKGLYVIQSIDSSSVLVTDDMSIKYRLNLEKTKKAIRFVAEELTDEETERKARLGKIQVKYIVGRLQNRIDALTMVEFVDTLYEMPHTKDRVEHE